MRPSLSQLVIITLPMVAFAASAQEPPDYLNFISRTERLAVASHSVGSCKRFGYIIDEKALEAFANEFVERAVRDGIPEGSANLLINAEIDAERERQEARLERAKANANDPDVIKGFMDYWQERCESLSADPVYGPFFRKGS